MKKLFVFIFLLISFSCSKKKEAFPTGIIVPDSMSKILIELHLAQASIGVNAIADSSGYNMADYQNYILQKHHIKKEEFVKSIRYYTSNPSVLKTVYDSVLVDLTRLQAGGEVRR